MYVLDLLKFSPKAQCICLAQVQASSSVIISKATTAPRRRSTNVKQKSLDQPPKLTSQKEPSQAASASTKSFSPVNMGLITPATSLQRLPSILPTPTPPPDVVSSTQPAHEEESPIDEDIGSASAESIMDAKQWPVESSLCLATDVEEDEDFYGFQMLNPQQCIMLPWTNVSTTERSLYVPPALGNILHRKLNDTGFFMGVLYYSFRDEAHPGSGAEYSSAGRRTFLEAGSGQVCR